MVKKRASSAAVADAAPAEAAHAKAPRTWSERFRELHPKRFFLETWQALDAEAEDARRERKARGEGYDWAPLVALLAGAAFLTVMDNEYFGSSSTYEDVVRRLVRWPSFRAWAAPTFAPDIPASAASAFDVLDGIRASKFYNLGGHAWWAIWRVLGYLVFPAILIRFGFKRRVRDYGLETRGMSEHLWIYGLMYAIVLVAVIAVSFTESFASYYPFYKLAHRSWFDFLTWEVLYAAQFFSLEFFFRGFWLTACRRAMGSTAIFAMVVPYCMIHFGKPMPETFGAILAGVALGTLAMKTRSIWSGFLIHVSVALSMDLAAMLQTAQLPSQWWPN